MTCVGKADLDRTCTRQIGSCAGFVLDFPDQFPLGPSRCRQPSDPEGSVDEQLRPVIWPARRGLSGDDLSRVSRGSYLLSPLYIIHSRFAFRAHRLRFHMPGDPASSPESRLVRRLAGVAVAIIRSRSGQIEQFLLIHIARKTGAVVSMASCNRGPMAPSRLR